MNFAVDHSGEWRVAVGPDRWPIVGWICEGYDGVRPVVVNAKGRPEVVHSGRSQWENYTLEHGLFKS